MVFHSNNFKTNYCLKMQVSLKVSNDNSSLVTPHCFCMISVHYCGFYLLGVACQTEVPIVQKNWDNSLYNVIKILTNKPSNIKLMGVCCALT
jgi:hypothetical protein